VKIIKRTKSVISIEASVKIIVGDIMGPEFCIGILKLLILIGMVSCCCKTRFWLCMVYVKYQFLLYFQFQVTSISC